MRHSHRPASRLTFGCEACIFKRRCDQLVAGMEEMDFEDLIDIANKVHARPDDEYYRFAGKRVDAELLRRWELDEAYDWEPA